MLENEVAGTDVLQRVENLEREMENLKTHLVQLLIQNKNLKKENSKLTEDIYYNQDKIYDTEVRFNRSNQYSRRENVEIHNIPESILKKDLEKYVITVLSSIGVKLVHYDIVATHRIGDKQTEKNRKVIVRFVNRKNAYYAIKNGRKLRTSNTHQYKNYFITENLCLEFRQIFNKLYKLKKLKQISRVWSYNGYVFFKFSDNDIEEPIQLFHYDDIESHINEHENRFSTGSSTSN